MLVKTIAASNGWDVAQWPRTEQYNFRFVVNEILRALILVADRHEGDDTLTEEPRYLVHHWLVGDRPAHSQGFFTQTRTGGFMLDHVASHAVYSTDLVAYLADILSGGEETVRTVLTEIKLSGVVPGD